MRAPAAATQQAEVAPPRKLSTRKGKQGLEVQRKRQPVRENANGNETLVTKLPLSRVVDFSKDASSFEFLPFRCEESGRLCM